MNTIGSHWKRLIINGISVKRADITGLLPDGGAGGQQAAGWKVL
jgi:hypothetical protein